MTVQASLWLARSPCFFTDVGGWVRATHKPNSVPASSCDHTGSNHLSRTTVTWRLQRPTRELTDEQSASVQYNAHYPLCLVLLRMGFTQPASHLAAGELLPHHFALTRQMTIHAIATFLKVVGRYVSVALSLRSPSLDVIQHPALWSSDFPRVLQLAIACFTQTHRT